MMIASIQAPSHFFPFFRTPEMREALHSVASKCLREFAAACAANVALTFFVSPVGAGLLATSLFVQSCVSLFFHSLSEFSSYRAKRGSLLYSYLQPTAEWCA